MLPNEIIKKYVQAKQAKLYKDERKGLWIVTTPKSIISYKSLEEMVQAMYQELLVSDD